MVSATPPGSPGSTLGSRTASLRSVRLSFKTVESFGSHNKIFKAGKNEFLDKLIYLRQKINLTFSGFLLLSPSLGGKQQRLGVHRPLSHRLLLLRETQHGLRRQGGHEEQAVLHHIHLQPGLWLHLTRYLLYKVPGPLQPSEGEGGSVVLQGLHNRGLPSPPLFHDQAKPEPFPADRQSRPLLSPSNRAAPSA